jgi:hypothetical protein
MTLIMLDVKTTFGNIVRDQSVSICMLQFIPGNAGLKIVNCHQFPNQIFTLQPSVVNGATDIIEKILKAYNVICP